MTLVDSTGTSGNTLLRKRGFGGAAFLGWMGLEDLDHYRFKLRKPCGGGVKRVTYVRDAGSSGVLAPDSGLEKSFSYSQSTVKCDISRGIAMQFCILHTSTVFPAEFARWKFIQWHCPAPLPYHPLCPTCPRSLAP